MTLEKVIFSFDSFHQFELQVTHINNLNKKKKTTIMVTSRICHNCNCIKIIFLLPNDLKRNKFFVQFQLLLTYMLRNILYQIIYNCWIVFDCFWILNNIASFIFGLWLGQKEIAVILNGRVSSKCRILKNFHFSSS